MQGKRQAVNIRTDANGSKWTETNGALVCDSCAVDGNMNAARWFCDGVSICDACMNEYGTKKPKRPVHGRKSVKVDYRSNLRMMAQASAIAWKGNR